MPRAKHKILKANHTGIIYETVVGSRERFQVPKSIRGQFLKQGDTVRITIEKVAEVKKK